MSERSSFVSQYFYNARDYEMAVKYFTEHKNEFDGEFDFTHEHFIISGYIRQISPSMEGFLLMNFIDDMPFESEIHFIVVCDCGAIMDVFKTPNKKYADYRIICNDISQE